MLSKKLISLVSAVLAMGILSGCNGASQNVSPTPSDGSQATSDSSTTDGGGSEPTSDSSTTDGGSGETVTHIVTFYDAGKVYGDPVTVNDGATVARPATDPTKEGDEFVDYTFDNWYVTGATEAYDFATPVTEDLDLYSKYNEVAKQYDLVVYVYGVNAAKEPTTYITEEESNLVLSEFKKLDGVETTTKILWHYVAGLSNTNFNKAVNESPIAVDLVISGNKLDNDDDVIACDATNGKVKMGAGWFANTSRYVAVTAACATAHKDLAVKLYNLAKNVGPDYAVTFVENEITIEVGQTADIALEYYGAAPTLELQNLDPAGCFTLAGLTVTAVATGVGKIVATDAAGHTAECSVTITAEPIPEIDLVVYVYGVNGASSPTTYITEEESNAVKTAFLGLSTVDDDINVKWVYSEGLTNPNFNKLVNDADPAVDVVISGNKLDNDTTSIACDATYGKVAVGDGWFENTSRKVAITAACATEHKDLAIKLYNMVKEANPAA